MSENKFMRGNPWTNSDVELLQEPPLAPSPDGGNIWTAKVLVYMKGENNQEVSSRVVKFVQNK